MLIFAVTVKGTKAIKKYGEHFTCLNPSKVKTHLIMHVVFTL